MAKPQHVGRRDVVRDHDDARRRLPWRPAPEPSWRQHRRTGQHLENPSHRPDGCRPALAQVFVLDLVELAHQLFEPRVSAHLL
ncbi:hypothetical protein ACTMU2_36235 [Cupriavidus basilensis]